MFFFLRLFFCNCPSGRAEFSSPIKHLSLEKSLVVETLGDYPHGAHKYRPVCAHQRLADWLNRGRDIYLVTAEVKTEANILLSAKKLLIVILKMLQKDISRKHLFRCFYSDMKKTRCERIRLEQKLWIHKLIDRNVVIHHQSFMRKQHLTKCEPALFLFVMISYILWI